ncbi:MAG: phosphatidate cytidylyltransferase [Planctomycetota bacterium]
MLKDRLRSSAILIAVATAMLFADARWEPVFGEGVLLVPLLLFLTLGTAWDMSVILRGRGLIVDRRIVLLGTAAVACSALLPTVWNAVAAGTERVNAYPTNCPVGQFGWVVFAMVTSIFASFLKELCTYRSPLAAGEGPGPLESSVMVRIAVSIFLIAYAGIPMSLLVATRTLGEGTWGLAALLTVVATTKSADAGAYFAGRSLGRRRLAPQLSPGKTWEGLLGGVAVATLVAHGCVWLLFPAVSPGNAGLPTWLPWVLGISLSLAGLVGDLAESLAKRDASAKDSGSWLPGLGGVWDVTDSLIAATLPGFLCFAAVS